MMTCLALGLGLAWACVDDKLLEKDAAGTSTDEDEEPGADVSVFANGIALDWAFSLGGTEYDMITSVTILAEGDAIVAGFFGSTVVFGEGSPTETILVAQGTSDLFLARFTADGDLVWARQAGSAMDNQFEEIATVASAGEGRVVLCATVGPEAVFGPGEENEFAFEDGGNKAVIALYGIDGTLEWAREVAGGDDALLAFGVRCAPLPGGGFAMVGSFGGTAVFGAGQATEVEISAIGPEDGFLAWLDDDGGFIRARTIGSEGCDGVGICSVGTDGTVVACGTIAGPVLFGAGEEYETEVLPVGLGDSFLAAFGSEGDLIWVNRMGGPGGPHDDIVAGTAGPDGSTIVVGRYTGLATLDSLGVAAAAVDAGGGGWQLYLASYSAIGELEWVISLAACYPDCMAAPMRVEEDGSILLTGTFRQAMILDPGGPFETTLENCESQIDHGQDFFIALLDREGTLAWARREGGPHFDAGISANLLGRDNLLMHGGFAHNPWGSNGKTVLGVGDPNETTLESAGDFDAFLARYSAR